MSKLEAAKSDLNNRVQDIKAKEPKIIKEFKDFINRGNVVDMAVGVIIGTAFSKIVASMVDNVLMPIVGLFIGGIDFTDFVIKIPGLWGGSATVINIGVFIQNVVDFVIVAFVIFLMVRFLNRLQLEGQKAAAEQDAAAQKQEDENTQLLREIRDALVDKKAKK